MRRPRTVWTVDADGSARASSTALPAAVVARRFEALFQRHDANPDRATLGVDVASSDGTRVSSLGLSEPHGGPRAPLRRGRRRGGRSSSDRDGAVRLHSSASTAAEGGSSPSAYRQGVARRQPDRLHAQQRHLGHPSRGGRPRRTAAASTRHTIPFPAWSPAGKQLAYNSGNQAVRRPHRLGARRNSSRRAPPVRAWLLPSLTTGLVSQRPAPVLLGLRSLQAHSSMGAWEGPRPSTRASPRSSRAWAGRFRPYAS